MTSFDNNLKKKLKEVFKKSIDFFDKYNLEWWACGGTAIGSIRHYDIIPWDDDIDIYMPRSSYNRLLELLDKLEKETGLKSLTIQNNYGYNHAFAKLYDPNTTIWEQKLFPYTYGVWLDIFILDNYPSGTWRFSIDQKKYSNCFRKYQNVIADYTIVNIVYALLHLRFDSAFTMIKSKVLSKSCKESVYRQFLAMDKSIQAIDGVNYVGYCEGISAVFSKKWFADFKIGQFGDYDIRLPIGCEDYLTHLYGDFMTPPPENKRVSGHDFVYVNLKEGLSLSEVKERIKQGEESNDFILNNGQLLRFSLFKKKQSNWM